VAESDVVHSNPATIEERTIPTFTQRIGSIYERLAQRPVPVLAALTLLAFLLRLGFMLATRTLSDAPTEDALEYHNLALNLLAGKGYTLDGLTPIVNRAPAFPVFLAMVYSLFGANPAAARVVQALLISALVPLVYFIGKRGWGPGVGLLASALFAVYPFSIFWGQYLITENLLVVLFVLLAAFLVRPAEAVPWRLLGAGGVMGLALLTRPTAFPVVVGLFVWLFFSVRGLRKIALSATLLLLGAVIAMSPWIVRNYSTYGQIIPFISGYGSSAGGYVFWISNNAYTAQPGERWGRYVAADLLPEYAEYTALPNDPALLDRKGYEYGMRYLSEHPADVPMLLLGKFLRFWNVFPGQQLYTRAIGALALLLLPFFLVGLWKTARKLDTGGLLLAFILGTMLVGLIFWADTRTRSPAEPFILLVAAVGAVDVWRRRTTDDRPRTTASRS